MEPISLLKKMRPSLLLSRLTMIQSWTFSSMSPKKTESAPVLVLANVPRISLSSDVVPLPVLLVSCHLTILTDQAQLVSGSSVVHPVPRSGSNS